ELAGPLGCGVAAGHMQAGPGIGRGDVDGGVLPDRALGSTEAADAEAVQLAQLTGMIDLQVPLRRRLGPLRLRRGGIASHQAVTLGAGAQAVAPSTRHTPLVSSRMPPHLGRASSAAIRAGPKPGWPRAKATTRCSTKGLVALALRGTRRSRGRRISGPCRSRCRFHPQ